MGAGSFSRNKRRHLFNNWTALVLRTWSSCSCIQQSSPAAKPRSSISTTNAPFQGSSPFSASKIAWESFLFPFPFFFFFSLKNPNTHHKQRVMVKSALSWTTPLNAAHANTTNEIFFLIFLPLW